MMFGKLLLSELLLNDEKRALNLKRESIPAAASHSYHYVWRELYVPRVWERIF
jgi:hypothetical protein